VFPVFAVTFETVRQLTAAGIVNGTSYGVIGVAFALILGVTGRFHFAFDVLYTLSAFFAFTLFDRLGLPFWPSALIGVLITVVMSMIVEAFVYRPLEVRAGGSANALLPIFVASLGLSIAGNNLVQIFWGAQTHSLLGINIRPVKILGANLINVDLYSVIGGVSLVALLTVMLKYTSLGRSIKATRSNPEMALMIGVDPERIYLVVFAIATFLAGFSAIFAAVKFSVSPTMGFLPVVIAFVVAFLGGITKSPVRVFLTGIAVGLIETISSIWLSVRWTKLVVFLILVLYLISLSMNRAMLSRLKSFFLRPDLAPAEQV